MKRHVTTRATLLLVCVWALPAGYGYGQTPVPQPHTPPAPSENATSEPQALRDPFWPIGWRPPNFGRNENAREKLDGQARWDAAIKLLTITGLSQSADGKYFAILKGAGLIEQGDMVSVEYDSLIYTWRIAEITSGGIVPKQVHVARKR